MGQFRQDGEIGQMVGQYSPLQPSNAQYSPVPSITAHYSPVTPSKAHRRPVQPTTAQYCPVQPDTAQYPDPASTAQYTSSVYIAPESRADLANLSSPVWSCWTFMYAVHRQKSGKKIYLLEKFYNNAGDTSNDKFHLWPFGWINSPMQFQANRAIRTNIVPNGYNDNTERQIGDQI